MTNLQAPTNLDHKIHLTVVYGGHPSVLNWVQELVEKYGENLLNF